MEAVKFAARCLQSCLVKLNLRNNQITAQGKQALIIGLAQNQTLCELVLNGQQDERIKAILARNCILNPSKDGKIPSDIALIKSVYRT